MLWEAVPHLILCLPRSKAHCLVMPRMPAFAVAYRTMSGMPLTPTVEDMLTMAYCGATASVCPAVLVTLMAFSSAWLTASAICLMPYAYALT